ncbi:MULTISPECIES: inverse autotransporter beta domain-containing protein [Pseudanabaena]|uniref:Inverse autotransporter beta-barrel domain-containing protein n=1 Tax=Pseudanabaena catenata USMAC16 TaxID=1855837 RepID=A0A9X4M5R2_9CYAN|nr:MULTISPECIES: inverse autotransporter beta-barrel domain-containing protein [Pseudanabaena]MDG3494271.1 inverse autotransporter beta-barrel domain-containing protein [Pseudanabaena catenata USMAC16]
MSQTNPFPLDAQLRYNGSGAGLDGNTSVELRIPLNQTPENFLYLNPQVRLFNNGRIGSNLAVGYRSLNDIGKYVLGGYLAYDNRDTGAQFFHQISAGLEFFAESWDMRLNAYLPVGKTNTQLSETILNSGTFQGTQFLIDRERRFDAAMGGVELEAGTIVNIGDAGYLRPYLGTYYYTATNSVGALGIKGGLAYYGDLVNAGLSIQNDRIFGTSILFNIGINLSNRSERKVTPPTLLDRMNEPISRNGSILVENQTVRDGLVAINPVTGQPYSFFVVADSTTGLSGTPNVVSFANFSTALANAGASGGNGIVYTYTPNGSTAPTFNGFTIPDGTKVISSAPSVIPVSYQLGAGGTTFSNLPITSNTGVYPIVNGTVTLASGSNQALIGYRINKNVGTTGANPAVIGNNNVNSTIAYNNVTITAPATTPIGSSGRGIVLVSASGNTNVIGNQVSNAIAEGIRLDNVSGNAVISGNTVVNTIQPSTQTNVEASILVRNNTGNVNLTIADNTVGSNTATAGINEIDGIEFSLCRVYSDLGACSTTANATVNITGNVIKNITGATDGADGIDINLGNRANATLTISSNTIDNVINKGISFGAFDGSIGTTTIAKNNISNVGGAAIQVRVGETNAGGESSIRAAVLNNKVTNTNTQAGVDDASMIMRSQNAATLCVRFEGNTLNNPTSTLDYLFRRQSTSASGLQLAGLTTAIATGNPSPALVSELTARGNTGTASKYRVQAGSVQIPTAACTFP